MKRLAIAGYTIIEVLIVLTVTATLFIAVVGLLSGRQSQAQNTQAVRDFESKIQGVASEVASGFYSNGFTCSPSGGAVTLTNAMKGAGENVGCLFLGKVMTLNTDDAKIYTVVGRQFVGAIGSADVDKLPEAIPEAVAKAGGPDVTENYFYRLGIKVVKMVKISGGGEIGGLGFIRSFGSSSILTSNRSVLLYSIDGATPTATALTDVSSVATFSTLKQVIGGVKICLLGSNGKKDELTIGASGDQTGTVVTIDSGVSAECA